MRSDADLKDLGFTDSNIALMKVIYNDYHRLSEHYDEFMGNFEFTKDEVLENIETITLWIENNPTYCLMYQMGNYYLTETFEN